MAADAPPLVLLVDDDPSLRMLVRECLGSTGFDVIEAENGTRAVSAYEVREPDIVLLDVMMPVMDGFDTCRALRNLPGARYTPILMMTGLDDVASIERAFEVGATDFVTKPISFALLPHRVSYLHRAGRTLVNLHQSERQLAAAQRMARVGGWELDLEDKTLRLSGEARAIFGLSDADPLEHYQDVLRNVVPEDRADVLGTFEESCANRTPFQAEFRVQLPNGSNHVVYQVVEIGASASQGHVTMLGMAQDITERRNAEKKIFDLAHFDPLTALPNRAFLKKQLPFALDYASTTGSRLALLSIGLDKFQRVNDTFGHDAGDALLREIADRLQRFLEAAPSNGTSAADLRMVARVGGDEFALFLPVGGQGAKAEATASALLDAVRRPIEFAGEELVVTASIGIAVFPTHGVTLDQLTRNAMSAMHQAEETGNDLRFHTEGIEARTRKQLTIESGLRRAVERNEFEVWFQPKIDIERRIVSGVEALARWRDPEKGIVPPSEFIGPAEETGLIIPLGAYVLETACSQMKRLHAIGYEEMTLAVNLSARQFKDPKLADIVLQIARRQGLDPHLLEVEITESALMDSELACDDALKQLKQEGVSIALDDFGTGYASLSYLKRFPIDVVKIDRSFVTDISTSADGAAIVEAILAMSAAMGKRSVAEGVESGEDLRFLQERGCEEAQGYYFSPPLEMTKFEVWLREFDAHDETSKGRRVSCGTFS